MIHFIKKHGVIAKGQVQTKKKLIDLESLTIEIIIENYNL